MIKLSDLIQLIESKNLFHKRENHSIQTKPDRNQINLSSLCPF